MQVKELMNTNVIKITKETKLIEAAIIMKKHDIGFLPITEGKKTLGVITDRDIVLALAKEKNIDLSVEKFMSKKIKSLKTSNSVSELNEMMSYNQIKRVLVTDNENNLVGVVSLADIARCEYLTEYAGETLAEISEDEKRKIESNSQRGIKVDDFPL